jgi:hypothetical protein
MKHTIIHILQFAPEWSEEHVIFYLIYFVLSVFGSSETILDVEVILEILPNRVFHDGKKLQKIPISVLA